MAQFVNLYKVVLNNGSVPVVSLKQIHYGDAYANRIGAIVYIDGQPAQLSGTCSGMAILDDGTTVPMTGTVSGNTAYVDLDPACYSVEGSIRVFVKLTTGDVTCTLLAAVGNVVLTETGVIIDPGTIIPSVSALIAEIQEAIGSVPADYSELLTAIAPTYSPSALYNAGDYVWYSGTLYRAIVDIPTAESWTPEHWDTAVIGEDIADLKSAFDASLLPVPWPDISLTKGQYIKGADGTTQSNSKYTRSAVYAGYGTRIGVKLNNNNYEYYLSFWDDTHTGGPSSVGYISYTGYHQGTAYIPAGAAKFAITFRHTEENGQRADMTDDDTAIIQAALSFYRPTDTTLSSKGVAADAQTVGSRLTGIHDAIGPWLHFSTSTIGWVNVDYADAFAANDVVYLKPLTDTNVSGNVVIYGVANGAQTNLGSVAVGNSKFLTLAASYDTIRLAIPLSSLSDGVTPYYCVMAKVGENGTIGGMALGNLSRIMTLETNERMYDSPFSVVVPNSIKGIAAVNIYKQAYTNYKAFRVSRVQTNATYRLFLQLQGYNGTDWVNIDTIAARVDEAPETVPEIELLDSTYSRFTVTVIWANLGASVSLSDKDYTLKSQCVDLSQIGLQSDLTALQDTVTANKALIDSPFNVTVSSKIKGILDVNVYNKSWINYQQFRISKVTRNSTYRLWLQLQGYNGSDWSNIDTIAAKIADAPSPVPEIELLDSTYGRFTITVKWADIDSSISLSDKNYTLKSQCVDLPQINIQGDIATLQTDVTIPSFELSDYTTTGRCITVAADGSKQYTTIGAAYAAITDSAFDKQYEIIVFPGTYHENNLKPPPYTHTHGIFPMTAIVDSTGTGDEEINNSVFDQQNGPSKLSNLWIKSATKYCVHQDVELRRVTLLNENLYCEKLPGGSQVSDACIGIGADFGGAKFIWRNCTFINGAVASHTNPNDSPKANQHIIYENCTFVNAYINLLVAGNTFGEYVCEVKGCKANPGAAYIGMKVGPNVTGIASNFPWQLIGGNNTLPIRMYTNGGSETADLWANVSTTEKIYVVASASVTKGKFVTIAGAVASDATPLTMIAGMAVADASSGEYLPVWKGPIRYTGSNGEYGLDANGDLSSSATIKIGRVYSNYFYPYYGAI